MYSTLPQFTVPLEPPFARWFFQSYRDCSLPWSAQRCYAGSIFSLAQAFVDPGRTRRTVGRAPARVWLPQDSNNHQQSSRWTSVTSVAKSPHPYRALPSGLSWRSCPTTDTTQGGCRDSRLVCCQVSGMGCSGNTTTSVGVVKSFAWSCVETSSSGALIIGELAPSTLLTPMLSTRA
ncbi:hypothetical protein MRX96_014369 [Rhipicephalus microplus]